MSASAWKALERELVSCEKCPRLRAHCLEVAALRRRAYREQTYWGRPVTGFGDREARILIVGLAPAAHGANRTGRMFTGDRSGEWLYAALHRAGLANQPQALSREDGLALHGCYVSAVCRCAPPDNRPEPDEIENCRGFLVREFALLPELRVVVALGGIAWTAMLRRALEIDAAAVPRPRPRFGHGAEVVLPLRKGSPPLPLLGCYHPSQQNTLTRRLTVPMLDAVFARACRVAKRGLPF